MERDELAGWLRLTLTPGVGNDAGRKLLAAFGLPTAIFSQTEQALRHVVPEALAQALGRVPDKLAALVGATSNWLHGTEANDQARMIVTLGDARYPASLLETADPPLILYTLGAARFDLVGLERSIAIVGSRNPTPQGASNARAFAAAFGSAGITVVSGMALGIDGAAHDGALGADDDPDRLATIAVVGTGLDRVYPARHRELAHRITARGLIVSEYPIGTPPLNQNFPKRNRIIAGLARGTLVVEAALQSGSLITARLAVEQGKEVFAIPGSIHSPQSRGCHALIRQGAKLVETVDDVLEELRLPLAAPSLVSLREPAAESRNVDRDGPKPHALLDLMGFDPVTLDVLGARTGHSPATLQAQLLELELEGRVARLPGGLFQQLASA